MKPKEQVRDFIVRFTLPHLHIEATFQPNDVILNRIFLKAILVYLRSVLSSQNLDTVLHKDFIAITQCTTKNQEIGVGDYNVGTVGTSFNTNRTRQINTFGQDLWCPRC